MSQALSAAHLWLAQDPDPHTREQLAGLIDSGDTTELERLFAGRLAFGTAGLRGQMGPGPLGMNRVSVGQAAAGLAAYLRAQGHHDGAKVAIGYDARHNSEQFALDSAEIFAGAGLQALLLPGPLPTPVLAFAIRRLGCVAAVMVTASHNPPADNGYKVYLGDGSQIIPPADAEIAAAIAAITDLRDVPRSADPKRLVALGDEVVQDYVAAVAGLTGPGARDLSWVYTPLHGVGAAVQSRVLAASGFAEPSVVAQQAEPDPDFPTVAFPNPEEPGAMDLALALAAERDADLVIAHDPDADRCAVAVRDLHGHRMLRGDETGALLGDFLLRSGQRGVLASSVVSSTLLGKIAAAHGCEHVETLTGFKWIGRVPGLMYGYEEALGYAVAPHIAADKDGISAGLLILQLAADLKAAGSSLAERLDEIFAEHGVHACDQVSVRVDRLERIAVLMSALRTETPRDLGGFEVIEVVDLAEGSSQLPPTDGLKLTLNGQARILIRPSGTEPKLKCYLEVVTPVSADLRAPGDAVGAARIAAAGQLDAIRLGLEHWLAHN